MRSRNLIDLADNPNFISGVHNYCDRWCERCPLTARCVVYATEEADPDIDPASHDITNAAFWQKLASIFQETREMLTALAEENGVDLSPSVLADAEEQNDRKRKKARNHLLARAAEEYARLVDQWFENDFHQMEVFSDVAEIPGEIIESDEYVNDYVEVIRWYQFFIAVKLIRSVSSRFNEDEYPGDEVSRDSDGSAKAALIAIDRSISAWKQIKELQGYKADSIQKLLFDLERLRLGVEREFPQARDFIRPGFDEDLDRLH